MTRKPPKHGLPPMHPGELLREEILPALDRPKTEIARLLGVSRQTLYDILEERQPITPWMALAPDISGVCSVEDTFEMTSMPTKTLRMKIVSQTTASSIRWTPPRLPRGWVRVGSRRRG